MRILLQRSILALSLAMASVPVWADDAAPKNPDPWEHFNRKVFRFNDAADRYAVKPAAKAYIKVTPQFVRDGIGNFFDNLNDPLTAINQVLQGKLKLAASDTGRFLVNSTIGVLGLFDVATKFHMPHHKEDFGQTLGVWGVGPGPFVMLPLAGPSTVRDLGGQGIDTFINPKNYYFKSRVALALYVGQAFNSRAELIPVEGIIQGDRYLFIRDFYLQHREFEIRDGHVDDPFMDDMNNDDSSGGASNGSSAAPVAEPAGGQPASGTSSAPGSEGQGQPAPANPEGSQGAPAGDAKGSDPFLDSTPAPEPAGKDSKQTP